MKKGQIEVTFNWIYIVIAGAVILLFFAGLIIKQKAASEERLAVDVVNILESIFSGAEVSENTKNFVETGALADEIIYFSCEDGIGQYGLEGYSYGIQNTVDPIFAPSEIKSPLLILWSIPYYLPFKVMDFLMVTSSNTKYYFIGEGNGFKEKLKLALGEQDFKFKINAEFITLDELNTINQGNNFQVRLVFLDGIADPASLPDLQIDRLTAISFEGNIFTPGGFAGVNKVSYYQNGENGWEYVDEAEIVNGLGERDAAKYAAIFAKDGSAYKCNMEKAFKRLKYLIQVYIGENPELNFEGKLGQIIASERSNPSCNVDADFIPIKTTLREFKSKIDSCVFNTYNYCGNLDEAASLLEIKNEDLILYTDCTRLY